MASDPPDFRTISDFRKRHLKALAALFVQVLKLAEKAGLVKLGHVALDGTKIKANASKHKAMSYERMKFAACDLAMKADNSGEFVYGVYTPDITQFVDLSNPNILFIEIVHKDPCKPPQAKS